MLRQRVAEGSSYVKGFMGNDHRVADNQVSEPHANAPNACDSSTTSAFLRGMMRDLQAILLSIQKS